MSPLESWLFIGLSFALLYAAFIGGGRIVDWILDRLFTTTSTRLWVGTDDDEESS
jgi:hypothetical protein